MLPQTFIDDVKKATDMLKLAKQYTEMKPAGNGIWQGRCPHPDHQDSTPSFRVWANQSWSCMGCHNGKKDLTAKNPADRVYGSDCFAFIQWMSGGKKSWKDAVMELAKAAEIPEPSNELQELYDSRKLIAESYRKNLKGQPYRYLLDRGLTDKDIRDFGIGFDGVKITFPLYDRYRNVLGFTRRYPGPIPEDGVKYKNSANNRIFNKSVYLYGMHQFDDDFGELRVTEGPTDVILARKYGVKNIVATLGTAFTDGHMELIRHYGKTPVFCMDGDAAGLKAVRKSVSQLAAKGIYSKLLILPEGKDMADMANELQYGLEDYIAEKAITYGYHCAQEILSKYDSAMLELRRKLYPDLEKVLGSIPDEAERHVIQDLIYARFGVNFRQAVD